MPDVQKFYSCLQQLIALMREVEVTLGHSEGSLRLAIDTEEPNFVMYLGGRPEMSGNEEELLEWLNFQRQK